MKINFRKASLYHPCFDADALFEGCDRRCEQVPHVMILGKSNVGKSSLFNSLTETKLARVSSTPGKTQALFFYMIDEQLLFVDMPGLGFAKVDVETKGQWSKLLKAYLALDVKQRKLLYLHDARRDWDAQEIQMLNWFAEKEVPIGIVITKCDKLNNTEFRQLVTKKNLPGFDYDVHVFFFSIEDQKLREDFKKNLTTWIES